jgi:hypothetical protein
MEIAKEEKVISEFLRALGPWREFVIIGGGYALFVYKLYLADKNLNPPIGTSDIDSLIPRKIPQISKKSIAKHLHEAGFLHVFKDLNIPAIEAYVKKMEDIEVEIEFLTDSATRNNKNKNVNIAGIVAQPLNYLTLSLQMKMEFQTYSRETGFVVSPGAWLFHKGLTFTQRISTTKMYKDLYGIWYVATQLGDFSERAIEQYDILIRQYPKWFVTLQKNLQNWIEKASPIEWSKLEMQDPFGRLKRLHFEKMIKVLSK